VLGNHDGALRAALNRAAQRSATFPTLPVILRQRPSQVCDTNIQRSVLRGGVGAGLTVFGHSDELVTFLGTSNQDRAKQKKHDNQPTQGRS
jgi:hypothetical protein